MRITENVSLVGSGNIGFETSHSRDCNVYVFDGGDEYALIDSGSGLDPERIVQNIEQSGIPTDRIKYLLLTHLHGDHAAGAHFFHKHLDLDVVCAAEGASWLEEGDMEKTSLAAAKKGGTYPTDFEFHACPVSLKVKEGDTVRVGNTELQVFNTPGHSRGHVSYLWEEDGQKSLFAGDTVFAGGKVVIQNIWDCHIQEYADTTRKLHELQLDRLYPGHGPFLLRNADEHVAIAHEYFSKLGIPPNLT